MGYVIMILAILFVIFVIRGIHASIYCAKHRDEIEAKEKRDAEFHRQCNRHDPPEAYVDFDAATRIREQWNRDFDLYGDIDR